MDVAEGRWDDRVLFGEDGDGNAFAYRPGELIIEEAALEAAQELASPGVGGSIESVEQMLGLHLVTGLPHPQAVARTLRLRGFRASVNHVFFAHADGVRPRVATSPVAEASAVGSGSPVGIGNPVAALRSISCAESQACSRRRPMPSVLAVAPSMMNTVENPATNRPAANTVSRRAASAASLSARRSGEAPVR